MTKEEYLSQARAMSVAEAGQHLRECTHRERQRIRMVDIIAITVLLDAFEAREKELKDLYSEILAGSGIEPCDEDGLENRAWIVPADPEPVICDSLSQALTTFGLLEDEVADGLSRECSCVARWTSSSRSRQNNWGPWHTIRRRPIEKSRR